jgi:hypothetical protein
VRRPGTRRIVDLELRLLGLVAVLLPGLQIGVALHVMREVPEAKSGAVARTLPYSLALADDGASVRLEGLIEFGITRNLEALLENAEGVRLVSRESMVGRVAEARGLIRVIERFGLMTLANGDCASACALAFMGGRLRYLDEGARVGFHRYGLGGRMARVFLDPAREQAKVMAVFRRHLVAEPFIERIGATPHAEMWFPEPAELLAAGVVDAIGRPPIQRP